MKCPNCKTDVAARDKYCSNCGYALSGNKRDSAQKNGISKKKRKTRKKHFFGLLLVIAVIAIGAGGFYLFGSKIIRQIKAKEAVKIFLDAYMEGDADQCGKLLIGGQEDAAPFSEFQRVLGEGIRYELGETDGSPGEYVIVKAVIKNVDAARIMERLEEQEKRATEEDILRAVEAAIGGGEMYREFVLDLYVYPSEERAQIMMTPELSNALFGGLNEYMDRLLTEEMERWEKNDL